MSLAQQVADSTTAQLYLFGGFRLTRGGAVTHLPTRKAEALLAYLVLFPKAHSREELAGLFWGDTPDEQARGSLRKALSALRRSLGSEAVLADRLTARLNPDFRLWVDAVDFEHKTMMEVALPGSLDLYRGDLLVGFYDDWIVPLREHYRALFLEQALSSAQMMRVQSEYTSAIAYAQQTLIVDPANERAHQHLMFCYLALGQRREALRQYELCRQRLWEELAVEPSLETTALYRWIKDGPSSRAAPEAAITNLPLPLSSFVGRIAELAQLKRLLQSSDQANAEAVRLITLTGPGGSGKTRLAVQVATDLLDAFPDGVWWVELASLSDGVHTATAVAKTLGVRESPDEPLLDTLSAFVRPRRLLLLLDNCEHVITACAELAGALLSHCPNLQIMTTSRQALGLIGEQTFTVQPLPVPRLARWRPIDSLLNFEGIRLFVDRARAVDPGFTLTPENAPAVMQIAVRLDGIPLAIELAAMWLKTLTAEELASRLDDRFTLLTLGSRTAPPRHQTLRAVLDWSYDLLPESEQALLRRLSVFAGGCTAETARAVADAAPAGSTALVNLLHRLVDKSLLVAQHSGGHTRYLMLETIRAYAREKLQAAGEAEAARDRHLALFTTSAEEAEIALRGPQQAERLEWLDRELDNIRAALEWALVRDVPRGMRLAGSLVWFWNLRGHWREGPAWLLRLLAQPDAQIATPARAKALVAAASLIFWGENDYATARNFLEEAIAIYRGLSPPDRWALADALALYGELLNSLREPVAARVVLGESLTLSESLGESGEWVAAWAWMSLADTDTSPSLRREYLERSAALFRRLGDRAQLPVVLARLAWFHLEQGEHDAAAACARESIALTEQIGDVMGAAWMLKLTGDLAKSRAAHGEAIAAYQDAYERFSRLGSKVGLADTLSGLGMALLAQGRREEARAVWSEALVLYEQMYVIDSRQWVAEQLAGLDEEPEL